MRCTMAVIGCLTSTLLFGCSDGGRDGFTEAEWDVLYTLSPLPDVEFDTAAAELGQKLFYDTRLSGPIVVGDDGLNGGNGEEGETGKVACGTCHMPKSWFVDSRSNPNQTSLGTGWTGRNAPTVVNVAYHESFPWHGKYTSIAELMVQGPLQGDTLMNSTPVRIAGVLRDHYQLEYDSLFLNDPLPSPLPKCFFHVTKDTLKSCPPADAMMGNVGYALEQYQRRLISRNAPFDQFIAGRSDAISDSAKRGLALFIGDALCIECHNSPNFSDEEFHNLGFDDGDKGRGDLQGYADQVGFFRTPSLRSVAETAPYMHNGQFEFLSEVVEFYWLGAGTGADHPALTALDLTEDDIRDIVAFLETLTGDPIPCELIDDLTCGQ